jgi:S-DNA-T family DNA segregation ATPase FtsK/SpoIIIE
LSTVVVKRPARRPAPDIPSDPVPVDPPPEIPQPAGSRWQQFIQVVPLFTGTVATALLFAGRSGGAYSYVIGGILGFSTLGMLFTSVGVGQPKKLEMMTARRDYLRHLAGLRRRVRETAQRQRAGLHYRHPDPHTLWSAIDSYRLWERRPDDSDFAVVRVAVGPQTLATPLIAPVTRPLEDLEPMTAGALRRFLDSYSIVPDLPVAVSLRSFSHVYLRKPAKGDAARDLVRAMVAQLATFHAPEDLLVAFCFAPDRRQQWDWVKWLPHALHPTKVDAAGAVRLAATSVRELEERLDDLLAGRSRFTPAPPGTSTPPLGVTPHVVVVLDGGEPSGSRHLATEGGIDGVTLVDLDTPPPRLLDRGTLVIDPTEGRLTTAAADEEGDIGVADGLAPAEIEALARQLAPLRLAAARGPTDAAAGRELAVADLLGIGDPSVFDRAVAWTPRPHRDRLRVTIGAGPDGQPVELDLKESAQDGMGPHGLLIGATGSGKSELLRTIVLGLAATHSSETLNVVLVDFKGGATFAPLSRLPHVAALITNLADELTLVDRMTDAINGELVRRQELLRRAGNYASLRDYEQARTGGAALAPLPSLLIICDEFSELLTAKPDFIDLFLQIGRVGRSLGVHLLLASQRLEEGRLRGLDTHLSYRIGLRTFSPLESRTVLGVSDAYELPRSPGHGYLKYGTETLTRFKAAYVSGPYRPTGAAAAVSGVGGHPRVIDYDTRYVPVQDPSSSASAGAAGGSVGAAGTAGGSAWAAPPGAAPAWPGSPATGAGSTATGAAAAAVGATAADSLLDRLVRRLAGQGPPAHQVWLPPLSTAATLDELLGPLAADPERGVCAANPQIRGTLQVPVALVDKPFEQRRDLMWLPLDGAAGHVAVVGGPQSGKSTALRTLIMTLALTHTPAEVQVYCLDFGGGQLAGLRDLPHVGGVAGRFDSAAVRRTVGEVGALLNEREQRFAAAGIDSMAAYRQQRAAAATGATVSAATADDRWGDVFLVIDGWATIRGDYDDLEPVITDLATRGLSYGIHLIAAASRWLDFRPAVRDLFGSRLELRLGDASDSLISRKAAANVPLDAPGRGLTGDALHFLVAQPSVSAAADAGGRRLSTADLVKAIAAGWTGRPAPQVRLLPASVPYSAIADDRDPANALAIPIGLAESDLRPARVDFAGEPHLLVFGDAECGKTTLLRTLAKAITERFAPEEARIVLVDYRRGLLGLDQTAHFIGYGTSGPTTEDLITSVAGYMERRLPGPDLTPEELRTRSWWTGPQCFVLVDDYDLVVAGPSNPLQPLADYLSQARDIGLHLVIARRSGGAARAMYEPILQRLRELSSPGLVMSGDSDEGALIGSVRPGQRPPGRGVLVTRREGIRLIQVAQPTDG